MGFDAIAASTRTYVRTYTIYQQNRLKLNAASSGFAESDTRKKIDENKSAALFLPSLLKTVRKEAFLIGCMASSQLARYY